LSIPFLNIRYEPIDLIFSPFVLYILVLARHKTSKQEIPSSSGEQLGICGYSAVLRHSMAQGSDGAFA
jgi:hypothetical protein